MKTTVFVVVSCHFAQKDELCQTTKNRLLQACYKAMTEKVYNKPAQLVFVVTGNVPYEKGSKTLAELMREYLLTKGWCPVYIGEGVGIFSESRTATNDIKKLIPTVSKVVVISSNWYFWAGAPLWKKFGKNQGLEVEIAPIYDGGGWKTKLTYVIYGLIVRTSLFFCLSSLVERQLTKMQSSRKDGFTFDGCK